MTAIRAGIDAGKTHHHHVVIDGGGKRLLSRRVAPSDPGGSGRVAREALPDLEAVRSLSRRRFRRLSG
ncbi:hypothetical protein GPZ77_33580 [Streptomyces sp. QHH-9511]|nr:hypothetical protein GPZ77_33580 [Streptomyces sp. QHH-9511]